MLTRSLVLPTVPFLHGLLDTDLQQPDLSSWCNGFGLDTKRFDAKPLDRLHARFHSSSRS